MKNKGALTIFIVGSIVLFVGYLFKIMHWPYAFNLLISGCILVVGGGVYFLFINRKN
ncbi:MAG: gliding motility protein GldL [Bacteroidia bacterium]